MRTRVHACPATALAQTQHTAVKDINTRTSVSEQALKGTCKPAETNMQAYGDRDQERERKDDLASNNHPKACAGCSRGSTNEDTKREIEATMRETCCTEHRGWQMAGKPHTLKHKKDAVL